MSWMFKHIPRVMEENRMQNFKTQILNFLSNFIFFPFTKTYGILRILTSHYNSTVH